MRDVGVEGYLTKPVEVDALLRLIGRRGRGVRRVLGKVTLTGLRAATMHKVVCLPVRSSGGIEVDRRLSW